MGLPNSAYAMANFAVFNKLTMYAIQTFFSKLTYRVKMSFTSGISPAKLALSITLAVLFGIFPFFFIPTLLIISSVFVLRLNIGVMLVFNYMAWPLQIILFIPYIHLGNWLFGSNNGDVTLTTFMNAFKSDFAGAASRLFSVILHTTGAWLVSSIPAGLIMFCLFYYIAKALAAKVAKQPL